MKKKLRRDLNEGIEVVVKRGHGENDSPKEILNRKIFKVDNDGIYFIPEKIYRFIKEIQEALTDKKKGGTKLNVNETGWLLEANEILNQLK